MNYFHAYSPRLDIAKTLPPLQRTIIERTRTGTINYHGYDIEITATLKDVAEAVESAYILTAKTDLPKVELRGIGYAGYYEVEGFGALATGRTTADTARKRANAWLAIAKHLEAKEAARAYEEAKAKAVAEAAAAAKQARLDELADEWFGKDYTDLGPNKAATINEIYRLETQINTKDAA